MLIGHKTKQKNTLTTAGKVPDMDFGGGRFSKASFVVVVSVMVVGGLICCSVVCSSVI